MNSNRLLLSDIHEDVDIVIGKVERSFGIKFTQADFDNMKTFGDMCDAIHQKVKHEHADTCTTQHAFYKLRNAISVAKEIDRNTITTGTCLNDIFFEDDRLWLLTVIEQEMGVELDILQVKDSVLIALFIAVAASLIAMPFNWEIGLLSLGLCVIAFLFAGKFGKELRVKTLGQLAEKVAREHYVKCRRNAATVNRNEINKKVKELFQHELDLNPEVLTPQATFN